MFIKLFVHPSSPISCETNIVPMEGKVITLNHHKHKGDYIVNSVEYTFSAKQENEIGNLKMEADVHVYLTEK